jgi:DNA-binding winged helix-turn-helix (wHTH) protein
MSTRFSFGDCVLEAGERRLIRAGREIHLPPKAFHLLEFLIEKRPEVVPKEKILAALWPGTYVSEVTLASLIARLRKAVGDSSDEQRLIRTVHGYGYAFCGRVSAADERAARDVEEFRLVLGDREIALPEGENLVGRARDCAVFVDDASVSRHHARISIAGDTVVLEDLGSKNGTYVAGKMIGKPVKLSDGAVIEFGSVCGTFRALSSKDSTKTSPRQRRPSTK